MVKSTCKKFTNCGIQCKTINFGYINHCSEGTGSQDP